MKKKMAVSVLSLSLLFGGVGVGVADAAKITPCKAKVVAQQEYRKFIGKPNSTAKMKARANLLKADKACKASR